MTTRVVPHRPLPAPTSGMQLAQRPTGIIVGLIIAIIAVASVSILPLIEGIATGVMIGLSGEQPASDPLAASRSAIMLALFSFAIAAAIIFLWVRVKERRPFASLGFTAPAGTTPVVMTALRGAGLALLMITLCVLVPVATGQASLVWRAPELDAAAVGIIALMLLGFLVQGSTEEIVTRGYFTQVVARRWGLVAAIIAQAIFFTALHGSNTGMGIMPVINLLLFAVFASLLSLADGSLWGICAFHGVWNWAQGNLFGVAVSGNQMQDSFFGYAPAQDAQGLLTGGDFGVEGSIVTTILYVVAALLAWRSFRRRAQSR